MAPVLAVAAAVLLSEAAGCSWGGGRSTTDHREGGQAKAFPGRVRESHPRFQRG